jgi:hypothetical protein
VYDLTVHEKNGKRWIGLPAKPQVERSGCVDRETRDAFSVRVIASEGAKWEPVGGRQTGRDCMDERTVTADLEGANGRGTDEPFESCLTVSECADRRGLALAWAALPQLVRGNGCCRPARLKCAPIGRNRASRPACSGPACDHPMGEPAQDMVETIRTIDEIFIRLAEADGNGRGPR